MSETNVFSVAVIAVVLSCLADYSQAAETSVLSQISAGYRYDDNVNVAPENQISLSGLEAQGSVELRYAMPRWSSGTTLRAGLERYDNLDFDSDNPLLEKPKTSDFNNETYGVSGDVSYSWERNTATLQGGYSRENTINTQFADGGLGGGVRQIEGAGYQDTLFISPGWQANLTERQVLDTSIHAQSVDFDSDRYVDYDYLSARVTWSYILDERLRLQARPLYSKYENKANFPITSETYGLEAGVIWAITEKWTLDALAGATQVTTEYGGSGNFIFNPITGQFEFVELEDADNNGFTGSLNLAFKEERYGFSAKLDSSYAPSGNGYLQERTEGRVTLYWRAQQHLRLNFDALTGYTDTSGDIVKNKRTFSEAAIRVAYQVANDWWLSARYRYREQDYDRSDFGQSQGNLVTLSMSYRLPKEIL